MIGQKFGRLTVIEACDERKRGYKVYKCKCDCGNITHVIGTYLRIGRTLSCGCLTGKRIVKHDIKYRLKKIYTNMKTRCYNKKYRQYKDWGGRGIAVCDEWKDDFMNFYNWATSNGYDEDLTIDRIDVDGDYEPSNCRWVTMKQQNNNKTNNILLTYNNKTQNIKQWCDELNINYMTVYMRYKRGWTDEQCLKCK